MNAKSLNGARHRIVENFTKNMDCSPDDIVELIFGIKPLYPSHRVDKHGRDKEVYVCSIETLAIVVASEDGMRDYLFVGEDQPVFDERIPLEHVCYDLIDRRLPANWEEDPENIIDQYFPEYKNADVYTKWDKIHEFYNTPDKGPFSTMFIDDNHPTLLEEVSMPKRKFVRFSTTATPKVYTKTEKVPTRKTPDRRRKDPWMHKEVTKTITYFPINILKR